MAFWVNKKKLSALAGKTATEAKKGHSKKWYFVTNIVLTYYEKNCSSDREKLLKFEGEGREFAKILRALKQFFQNRESSEQFLVIELTCSWRFLIANKLEQ